jgi:hypothetical protein
MLLAAFATSVALLMTGDILRRTSRRRRASTDTRKQ